MKKKDRICALLKGIETGDPASVEVVNEEKYIQHNPQTHEGSVGLAELFKQLSKTSPRVNIVRAFEDGDFVFAHTEYDFATSNIGFEIFRFEDDQAVEHWDNIQLRKGPNMSGHSMVDGPTEADDLDKTEFNRNVVKRFVSDVLINRDTEKLVDYLDVRDFTEHNPGLSDDQLALRDALSNSDAVQGPVICYQKQHRVLAEGSFVLSVCEGTLDDVPTSFFDLFQIKNAKIIEHWDTTEAIPPRSEWKNDNGKF